MTDPVNPDDLPGNPELVAASEKTAPAGIVNFDIDITNPAASDVVRLLRFQLRSGHLSEQGQRRASEFLASLPKRAWG